MDDIFWRQLLEVAYQILQAKFRYKVGLSSPISKSQIRSFPKKSCLHVKTTLFVDKQGWDSGEPLKEWANSVQRPTMNKTRCDDELFVRYLVSIIYTQQLSCRGTSIRIVMSPMPYIYMTVFLTVYLSHILYLFHSIGLFGIFVLHINAYRMMWLLQTTS